MELTKKKPVTFPSSRNAILGSETFLTAIAAKVYNVLLLNRIRPETEQILLKNQCRSQRNYNTSSVFCNTSNHWRSTDKKYRGNTTVRRFLQGIRFHSSFANINCIWFSQRDCFSNTDALQKHESNALLSWWRHWILQLFCWSLARRYMSTKWQTQTTQIIKHVSQIHQPKQNPYYTAWSYQQKALASMRNEEEFMHFK